MSAPRETVAFVMGAITGHALAQAHAAQTDAKLARVREALRWTRAEVASHHTGPRERAHRAWEETA